MTRQLQNPDLYRVTVVRKPDPKQQQVLVDALKKKQQK